MKQVPVKGTRPNPGFYRSQAPWGRAPMPMLMLVGANRSRSACEALGIIYAG